MSEWREVQLRDIVSILGDGLHGTPEYSEDGSYYFVNGNNLNEGSIIINQDTQKVSYSEYLKYKKELGDRTLLVSINGTLGNVAYYRGEKVILGKSACYFNLLDHVDKGFIRYVLSTPYFQKYIQTYANGTTIKNLSLKAMREFSFDLPPLQEQKEIANILSCLDRKISNLRQQNETLERIAQTLFKHWFVDFEFLNEDGKPYRSSGGEMVRSELGEIPVGWAFGKLSELITVNPRESTKQGTPIKYVDMKSLSTSSMEITDFITREFISGSKFRNGDTLLARITPCLENGKTAFVNILDEGEVAYGSTEFIVMRANTNCCPEYVYCLSRSLYFRDYAIKNMTGSSGRQRVPNDRVENYELVVPASSIIHLFHSVCNPLFLKIKSNQRQIQTLTKTRDVLLPKLMSGKLRITD